MQNMVHMATLHFTKPIIDCLVAIRVKPGRLGLVDDKNYGSWVEVQRRDGFDGTKWAVIDAGLVLNKQSAEWEYEPLPSSRSDRFLKECRFDTFPEAVKAALICKLNGQ